MDRNALERLDSLLDDYHDKHGNSGYIRLTLKGEIIFEKNIGYADLENKTPFTRRSAFTFYSLSKPFCAMGLLKLKDRHLLDLDLHPSKYLPEAEGFDRAVTVRHLLHHVSGLPDFVQTASFHQKYPSGAPALMREHLKELTSYPSVFAPGEGSMYANVNFIICALLIENISGMPYGEYMKKEVFEPLSMPYAQVDSADAAIEHRVHGHERTGGAVSSVERTLDWMLGAGDIVGTADDVYCLNRAIKQKLLLKEDTWKEALTPSPLNSMGMGCTVEMWHERKRIKHNGGSRGFRTLHIQVPKDDFDMIFLSNAGWGLARETFSEAVYDAFYGGGSPPQDEKMDFGYI